MLEDTQNSSTSEGNVDVVDEWKKINYSFYVKSESIQDILQQICIFL